MTIKIFVGDVDESLSLQAKEHDNNAILIDHKNYQILFDKRKHNQNVTVYTSLGDIKDPGLFYDLLCLADIIHYCPPLHWTGEDIDFIDPTESVQGFTEHVLLSLKDQIEIISVEKLYFFPAAQPLSDFRKTKNPQLWVVGCSISHGIGVDINQRYGNIISREMDMPCSFLTRPGSSIDWAADQIVRSDIVADDIVVWGVTEPCRVTYVHEHKLLNGINAVTYKKHPEYKKILPENTLLSQDNIYRQIYAIERAINFCKKSQAKLLMVGLLNNPILLRYLNSFPEYIRYPYKVTIRDNNVMLDNFCDLGDDHLHPGPEQHKLYANFIVQQLVSRNIYHPKTNR